MYPNHLKYFLLATLVCFSNCAKKRQKQNNQQLSNNSGAPNSTNPEQIPGYDYVSTIIEAAGVPVSVINTIKVTLESPKSSDHLIALGVNKASNGSPTFHFYITSETSDSRGNKIFITSNREQLGLPSTVSEIWLKTLSGKIEQFSIKCDSEGNFAFEWEVTNSVLFSFDTEAASDIPNSDATHEFTNKNISLALGDGFSCAVVSGAAFCWGRNEHGELGNDSFVDSTRPVQAQGLSSGVTAMAAGKNVACAVVNASVYCWGDNSYHQLAQNGTFTGSFVPLKIDGLESATSVAVGLYHVCALLSTGHVWCWGLNNVGQLAANPSLLGSSFTPIEVSTITNATALVAGTVHNCAIVNDGVQCWGDNSALQLGDASPSYVGTTPSYVTGLPEQSGAISISTGMNHNCVVLSPGKVKCWGSNQHGELGIDSGGQSVHSPSEVSNLGSEILTVSAGGFYDGDYTHYGSSALSCALINGQMSCWGSKDDGQLGNSITNDSSVPVVMNLPISGIKNMAAGSRHVCATDNNKILCWGLNSHGELGNNSTTDSSSAVFVDF